jgi:hypothetical protein
MDAECRQLVENIGFVEETDSRQTFNMPSLFRNGHLPHVECHWNDRNCGEDQVYRGLRLVLLTGVSAAVQLQTGTGSVVKSRRLRAAFPVDE